MCQWEGKWWFPRPIRKRDLIMWLSCLECKVICSLVRAKMILMETWSLCDLYGIWVIKLCFHTGPSGTKIRSRVWSWLAKEGIELIREEKRIKRQFLFWELDTMILVRSLTENEPRERNGPLDRACYISRFHCQNWLKFGGPIEKSTM